MLKVGTSGIKGNEEEEESVETIISVNKIA
jgi:hypothetical protein